MNPFTQETTTQEQPCCRLVMLIDDDPINNLICQNLIYKTGFAAQVIALPSARQALQWFRQQEPQDWPELILLDLNMPELSGWEFLERFAAEQPQARLPIYILSSSVSEADQRRADVHAQIQGYLIKPLTVELLTDLSQDRQRQKIVA